MDPVTNKQLILNPVTLFSLGTAIGVGTVYCFLRFRKKVAGSPATEETIKRLEEYRLIIGVRNDLKMQKGKVAAQCGHAAVAAYAKALKTKPKTLKQWLRSGQPKITVKINSEEELLGIHNMAQQNDVLSSVVRDAGQTQVAPGTRTVIAIGPAAKSDLDKMTGHLKLY